MSWSDIDEALEKDSGVGIRWIIEALRYEGFNQDSISKCQMISKIRLCQLLGIVGGIGDVAICGSWYGQLATMLDNRDIGITYTGIDIDSSVEEMATHLNRYAPFTHVTANMYDFDYDGFDTVINTSCEHIDDLRAWLDILPGGTRVALQSNNALGEEGHISCVESLQEFKDMAQLPVVIYDDVLELPIYTRYTLIGRV